MSNPLPNLESFLNKTGKDEETPVVTTLHTEWKLQGFYDQKGVDKKRYIIAQFNHSFKKTEFKCIVEEALLDTLRTGNNSSYSSITITWRRMNNPLMKSKCESWIPFFSAFS